MNAKQARRARALANATAQKDGLWAKIDAHLHAKFRHKIGRHFAHIRRRYADETGRAYRWSLANMTDNVVGQIRSGDARWSDYAVGFVIAGDTLHNERLRARIRSKWEAKQARARDAKRRAMQAELDKLVMDNFEINGEGKMVEKAAIPTG